MDKVKFYRNYREDGTLEYEGFGFYDKRIETMSRCGFGVSYSKDGKVSAIGIFERAGLIKGRLYYSNGNVKYEGDFFRKKAAGDYHGGGYYGPTYPTVGKYYSEDGQLIYEGKIKVEKVGSLGYPVVIWPDGKRGQ